MAGFDRFTADGAGLLVVDLQERLLAAIPGRDRIVANTLRLLEAARLLQIKVDGSEQNPARLDGTVATVAAFAPNLQPKMSFRITDFSRLERVSEPSRLRHVTIAGIETHVCVAQTVLELLSRGFRVQVVADAVGARSDYDHDIALRRLENAGAVITTTEAALFEWIETADHPQFKAISTLIKNFARLS